MNRTRLGTLWREVDDRLAQRPAPELLSVTQSSGVVPRTALTDRPVSASDLTKYKVCRPDDLVLNRFNAYRGALGVARQRGIVSPDYLVLRPLARADSRYLEYLLRSQGLRDAMTMSMGGIGGSDPDSSGFSRIDTYALHRVKVPARALAEQRAIADFLDRETAKIDALIEKQTELITRLHERRADLIDRAVSPLDGCTAGLPLKRFIQRIEQGFSPDTSSGTDDAEVWVLKSGASNRGVFDELQAKPIPDGVPVPNGIEVTPGDLIVSRASGSPDLVGSAALVRKLTRRVVLSDKNFRVVPNGKVTSEYLYWALNSRSYRSQVLLAISGADGLANNLPLSSLKRIVLRVPPSQVEQDHVAGYLDRETARIDELIGKTERMIELSRERRSALITAAVTGQIDVNEHGGAA